MKLPCSTAQLLAGAAVAAALLVLVFPPLPPAETRALALIIAAIVAQDLADRRARFAELTESGEPIVDTVIDRCAEALDKNFEPDRVALILEVMAEAARNPQVAAIVQDADTVERQLVLRVLDHARSLGCGEAELAARGEVLSMIYDGMLTRAVNNPGADRTEIVRVLRAVLERILTSPPMTS